MIWNLTGNFFVYCVQSMANASDILRRLNDSVTCPICFLILDKPKSLPCGHTFCCGCIDRVWERIQNNDDDDEIYGYRYAGSNDDFLPVCCIFLFFFLFFCLCFCLLSLRFCHLQMQLGDVFSRISLSVCLCLCVCLSVCLSACLSVML